MDERAANLKSAGFAPNVVCFSLGRIAAYAREGIREETVVIAKIRDALFHSVERRTAVEHNVRIALEDHVVLVVIISLVQKLKGKKGGSILLL